jgi:hypothetical protein
MSSRRFARRLPAVAGASAIVVMVALTAGCGGGGKNQPSTTTPATTTATTTTTPPPPSPTEKNINPTGGNLFTPEPHPVQPAPSQNPHRRGAS